MSISGMNSYLSPKTKACNNEQYAIRGIEIAMYSVENRSSKNTRCFEDAGARRSNAQRKAMSQKIVYAVLIGNSAAVKSNGNSETCPATARGRKAPR